MANRVRGRNAVAVKQKNFVYRVSDAAMQQKRNKKRAGKLCAGEPDRIEWIAVLKRKDVNENRPRAEEQDVGGSGVLQPSSLIEKGNANLESKLSGGVQHAGG